MLVDIHEATEAGNTITLKRAFTVQWRGRKLRVPKNFESDGASIPRLLWRLVSPCIHQSTIRASIAHDFLYRTTPEGWTRKEADQLFRDLCKRDGLADFRATIAYLGLQLFGWWSWGKNKETKEENCE